jgi:hypothetical protein
VGFLYKTDASNPGEFDLDLYGTWNEREPAPFDNDAPYTKSLAYNGVDCNDYWSDQSELGSWQTPLSYFGQTFVATGDRVVSARVHGTIGGNYLLDWNLQIVTFPGLQPVGPNTTVPVRDPHGWEAFWGVNDCPVVPGQTYMLQVNRGGGLNIWRVKKNVYTQGQYYEGTNPRTDRDLNGHICCMTYGSSKGPDLYEDGKIDFRDYGKLAQYWRQNEPSADIAPPYGDGIVDSNDLALLLENWLTATTTPPLPEQASNPDPPDGATEVDSEALLSWTAGARAISHDIYLGTGNPPLFIGNQTATTFDPGWLSTGTQFYWRIDEKNGWGKTEGPVWNFTATTTLPPPPPPGQAINPNPANGTTGVGTEADLSWTAGLGTTSHNVYFGKSSPPPFIRNQAAPTFDPGMMDYYTRYYWRIDEITIFGTIPGPIWNFTTIWGPPPPPP